MELQFKMDEFGVKRVRGWNLKAGKAYKTGEFVLEPVEWLLDRIKQRFLEKKNPDGREWPKGKLEAMRREGKNTRGSDGNKYNQGGPLMLVSKGLFNSIQARAKGNLGEVYTEYYTAGRLYELFPDRNFMGISQDEDKRVREMIAARVVAVFED